MFPWMRKVKVLGSGLLMGFYVVLLKIERENSDIGENEIERLEEDVFLQLTNAGAMILDMNIPPVSRVTYYASISNFHAGNFALTKEGVVYFVSDCENLKKIGIWGIHQTV